MSRVEPTGTPFGLVLMLIPKDRPDSMRLFEMRMSIGSYDEFDLSECPLRVMLRCALPKTVTFSRTIPCSRFVQKLGSN
jgi:hypothetical protein